MFAAAAARPKAAHYPLHLSVAIATVRHQVCFLEMATLAELEALGSALLEAVERVNSELRERAEVGVQ